MQNIIEIEDLIKLISKLPGLGPKSAKRIVLKLINNRDELIKPMANTLAQVYKNVTRCNFCGSLKSNIDGCANCESVKEKFNKICVVEDIADQWSIENSNIYKGYFHILGGTIASAGHRKEELLIKFLRYYELQLSNLLLLIYLLLKFHLRFLFFAFHLLHLK